MRKDFKRGLYDEFFRMKLRVGFVIDFFYLNCIDICVVW